VSAAGGRFTSHLASGGDGVAIAEGGVAIAVTVVPALRYVRQFGGTSNNGTEIAHIRRIGVRYTF
jgi:hypothetical protein